MNHFDLQPKTVGNKTIAHLYFDLKNEKVNKFNREVMAEFETLIETLKVQNFDALILFSRKPGNFIAGAFQARDIT
jgi:enoyl-CoA hydratase/carnithine racemase